MWKAAGCPERHGKTIVGNAVAHTEWWGGLHWTLHAIKLGGPIALVGGRGTGKTQIAVEVIRNRTTLAEHPVSCRYIRAAEIFQQVRECYGTGATRKEAEVIATFLRPWLLVIDEAHDRAHSDAEGRLLNLIIDKRYGSSFPTLFIANATPEEFRKQIGESIYDRMAETGGIASCNWKSFRAKGE